jgi:hypothetical protein
VNNPDNPKPPSVTRVIVTGNADDPGSVTINASDGFIKMLRDAGYTVTPA